MDGNGRWAQERGMERMLGHEEGAEALRRVIDASIKAGVRYLTVYVFSTENWQRPKEEVDALMELLVRAIGNETHTLIKKNVRLMTIGDLERLSEDIQQMLEKSVAVCADSTGLTLTLAISYSARWELTEAARKLAREVQKGSLSPHDISEETLAENLSTRMLPDPDLLIRTGGEKRISNFLLWQSAYTELYFVDTYWPDLQEKDIFDAIDDYIKRERRFGRTSQQLIERP